MSKRHMLIMVICCLAPLVALGAIFLFKVPVGQALYIGLVLLCPLSHLLMMKYMGGDEGHRHGESHHPDADASRYPEAVPAPKISSLQE